MHYIIKRWQYGFTLSTKYPSEITNKFEKSLFKISYLLGRNKTFCNKIKIFCDFLRILRSTCFESNWIDKNKMFSEMEIMQCIKNNVVINFYDVIRKAHCALNIESAQPVAI